MVLKAGKYNIKMLMESFPGEDFFLVLYMAAFTLKFSFFSYRAIKSIHHEDIIFLISSISN